MDSRDGTSVFEHLPLVPEPPIYAVYLLIMISYSHLSFYTVKAYTVNQFVLKTTQVMVAFSKDPNPLKLNLGVGVYHTEVSLFLVLICSNCYFHNRDYSSQ